MTDLPIPDEALNSHIGILGKVGSGKTYTAKGLVERLLHLRRHVVIIDPTGAWYGLRTGFEIPIFGGRHGDVEISDKAGEAVAGVIVDQRTSAIIDLSLMTGGGQQRFMRTFAHRLRQKPLGALYLVIDEADEFLPQNVPSDQTNAYGDLRWMVRRGRLSGFRVMMITQRPAEIAKAVLTQIETLIAHRLTAPQDRKAIEEWVKGHHDPAEAREVLNSLASLEKGTAWVWAPDLGILKREAMPPIETFDSSRTPEPGEAEVAPPRLEALDLSAIREALAVVEEPAAAKGGKAPSWPDQREEVARLSADNTRLREQMRQVIAEREHARSLLSEIFSLARKVTEPATIISSTTNEASKIIDQIPAQSGGAPAPPPSRERATPPKVRPHAPEGRAEGGVVSGSGATATELNSIGHSILDNLKRIAPAWLTWTRAAQMADRSPKSGPYFAAKKQLMALGLVEVEGQHVRAPGGGDGLSRAEAIEIWRLTLEGFAPRMLSALADQRARTRQELGDELALSIKSGPWFRGLKDLRERGLMTDNSGYLSLVVPVPGERPGENSALSEQPQ